MSRHPMMPAMDEPAGNDEALRREAKDWVLHVATGAVTKGDLQALERWRAQSPGHAEAYAEACALWQALEAPLEAALAARGRPAAGRPSGPRRPVGRRAVLGGALAAATAAAAGLVVLRPPWDLWPSWTELAADYRTGAGEQQRIALAGHGSIELNTRTSLNLHGAVGDADSVELIAGEAAVAAGPTRLTVLAAAGRASASDAQFTIRRDGPTAWVTCLSGMVEIACRGQRAILVPRHQLAYGAEGLGTVTEIDPEVAAGWRDGLLVFDNERLSRVVEEINRYRTRRIILMNAALGERRITARFKLDRLDAVLTQFQAAFGAKATPLPGGFVLLS